MYIYNLHGALSTCTFVNDSTYVHVHVQHTQHTRVPAADPLRTFYVPLGTSPVQPCDTPPASCTVD